MRRPYQVVYVGEVAEALAAALVYHEVPYDVRVKPWPGHDHPRAYWEFRVDAQHASILTVLYRRAGQGGTA